LSTKGEKQTSLRPPQSQNSARTSAEIGVIFTNGLSVSLHVKSVITSCAQTLNALRVLRAHGLCESALQTVFRAVMVAN